MDTTDIKSPFLSVLIAKSLGFNTSMPKEFSKKKYDNLLERINLKIGNEYFNIFSNDGNPRQSNYSTTLRSYLQPRAYGCWAFSEENKGILLKVVSMRNSCNQTNCKYHPQTSNDENVCNISKSKIWEKHPGKKYLFTSNYVNIVFEELLNSNKFNIQDVATGMNMRTSNFEATFHLTKIEKSKWFDIAINSSQIYIGKNIYQSITTTNIIGNKVKRTKIISSRIVRDNKLSLTVKELYDYKCQICNITLSIPTGRYAEGAHIQPLGSDHNGNDNIENLLCLCPNHHKLFDAGAIMIHNNFDIYDRKSRKIGKLTKSTNHNIDANNLKYHREHIFESK
jgi:predicted restriction endonuclease